MQSKYLTLTLVLFLGGAVMVSLLLMGASAMQVGLATWLYLLVALIGFFVANQLRRRPNGSH
ncbi:MAG: hypothetical protein KDE09_03050 [Anaerolineales bacterium]|nr:hypothetical protein [Anaerolineales bacterium]MCB0008973.1 hypothetical protein [Anaerolineales bacterium]MCB0012769.1 hypothetical protein [Anaerolineales bacterium]MCB0016738.1 hypothetical protein [Anaerolineales bacterium]MCB0031899.1 hypothetical protein [Anaerolineales bacterium]